MVSIRNDRYLYLMSRYFEDDDEDHRGGDLEYQPAPGSPTLNKKAELKSNSSSSSSESEDDPLDAFMAQVEVTLWSLICTYFYNH